MSEHKTDRHKWQPNLQGGRMPDTSDAYIEHGRLLDTHESAVSRLYFQMIPPTAVDFVRELMGHGGKRAYLRHKRAAERLGIRYLLLIDPSQITDPGAEALGAVRAAAPRPTPYSESEFG